jgi:nitrogen fixation protein NifU and related proteins
VAVSSNFEEYQKQLIAEMEKLYSETVMEHALNPRNMREINDADGASRITGPCGDTMQIWLKVKDNIITDAAFSTDGCGTTRACGNIAIDLILQQDIKQAIEIDQEKILKSLGDLPEDDRHCALLAANTLKAAIQDYFAVKKEPWKKVYRKK